MAMSDYIFGPNTGTSIAQRREAREMGQRIADMGRGGDTAVIHATPFTRALLKSLGGVGTKNPDTGLTQFYDPWDALSYEDNSDPFSWADVGSGRDPDPEPDEPVSAYERAEAMQGNDDRDDPVYTDSRGIQHSTQAAANAANAQYIAEELDTKDDDPTSDELNQAIEEAGGTNLTSDTSDVDYSETGSGNDFDLAAEIDGRLDDITGGTEFVGAPETIDIGDGFTVTVNGDETATGVIQQGDTFSAFTGDNDVTNVNINSADDTDETGVTFSGDDGITNQDEYELASDIENANFPDS